MIFSVFSLLGAFMLWVPGIAFSGGNVTIRILKKAETHNDHVFLGDIAEISGDGPQLIRMVRQTDLGPAPLPGSRKQISRKYVLGRLKQRGIDLSGIHVIAPHDAVVTGSGAEISKKELRKIVSDFLARKLPWDKRKVKITQIRVDRKVVLPDGNITYKIAPARNADYLGRTMLSIDFSVNGRFVKRVWVSADIEVYADVVVTTRPLGRYKIITGDDVHLAVMNLAKLPSGVITTCKDVVGKRTRRSIDANTVLQPNLVELPPLVRRGDIVLIVAESEGLKVTALGRIKEKGTKGQIVRVENIDSHKRIYARVLDSNHVKVDF